MQVIVPVNVKELKGSNYYSPIMKKSLSIKEDTLTLECIPVARENFCAFLSTIL